VFKKVIAMIILTMFCLTQAGFAAPQNLRQDSDTAAAGGIGTALQSAANADRKAQLCRQIWEHWWKGWGLAWPQKEVELIEQGRTRNFRYHRAMMLIKYIELVGADEFYTNLQQKNAVQADEIIKQAGNDFLAWSINHINNMIKHYQKFPDSVAGYMLKKYFGSEDPDSYEVWIKEADKMSTWTEEEKTAFLKDMAQRITSLITYARSMVYATTYRQKEQDMFLSGPDGHVLVEFLSHYRKRYVFGGKDYNFPAEKLIIDIAPGQDNKLLGAAVQQSRYFEMLASAKIGDLTVSVVRVAAGSDEYPNPLSALSGQLATIRADTKGQTRDRLRGQDSRRRERFMRAQNKEETPAEDDREDDSNKVSTETDQAVSAKAEGADTLEKVREIAVMLGLKHEDVPLRVTAAHKSNFDLWQIWYKAGKVVLAYKSGSTISVNGEIFNEHSARRDEFNGYEIVVTIGRAKEIVMNRFLVEASRLADAIDESVQEEYKQGCQAAILTKTLAFRTEILAFMPTLLETVFKDTQYIAVEAPSEQEKELVAALNTRLPEEHQIIVFDTIGAATDAIKQYPNINEDKIEIYGTSGDYAENTSINLDMIDLLKLFEDRDEAVFESIRKNIVLLTQV